MADPPSTVRLNVELPLIDSERRGTSMQLPVAIQRRLDVMASLAKRAKASRAEIVAMLIAEADLDATSISTRIMDYRDLRVADVLPPGDVHDKSGGGKVVELPVRGPGRPGRSAS
jgi:hypothetical protein